MANIEKFDAELAAAQKLDQLLYGQKDKLNYLLVVKLRKSNKTLVSSYASREHLKHFKKRIKEYEKDL